MAGKLKKSRIKVSIVLGIYNAERTLKECLNSIFIQDYPKSEYEVIVVDGGSNDNTLGIVKDFMIKNKNLLLVHNSKKFSEGRGMSKDIGVDYARGDIVIFLDHDNIILHRDWLHKMMYPFKVNSKIMASQSMLQFLEGDSNFLKYINALGVEDPFAVPHSLVSQVVLHPEKFKLVEDNYYVHNLNEKHVLYGGANGGAFRREVFQRIGGYTRDVDVYASMASLNMVVAVVKNARIYHKTSNDFLSFMKKKGVYFYRFIDKEYTTKKFQWIPKDFSGKIRFYIQVAGNLSIISPLMLSIRQAFRSKRLFWLLHPFYLFFITLEYGLITLYRLGNFIDYGRRDI